MKLLLIGDSHVRPGELSDAQVLVDQICEVANSNKVDSIVFLGDQFDTHSIIHSLVMNFWRRAFKQIKEMTGVFPIALVGNHDYTSDGSGQHAMASCDGLVQIIERPIVVDDILYVPYIHNNQDFLTQIRKYDVDVLVGHVTIDGASYENGFYAQGGVKQSDIPQRTIISGHIHKPAKFGNVFYTGASRWLSANDANQERQLWLYDGIQMNGIPSKCRQKVALLETEAAVHTKLPENTDVIMTIRGNKAFVSERLNLWKGKCKIRTDIVEDTRQVVVSESKGIDVSFVSWFQKFQGVSSRENLAKLVLERLNVNTDSNAA